MGKGPKTQVCVQGFCLKGKTASEVFQMLQKCSIEKPINIRKTVTDQEYCHVGFKNITDASFFYHLYKDNKRILCRQLNQVAIKPSRINNVPVTYDIALCQKKLKKNTLEGCTCSSSKRKRSPSPCPSSIPHEAVNNSENVPPACSVANLEADTHSKIEKTPVSKDIINATLCTALDALRAEINQDEANLEKKRKRLKLLESTIIP